MSTTYIVYPNNSGGGGVPIYANFAALPAGQPRGTLGVTADTNTLYEFNGTSWVAIASAGSMQAIGPIDSQPPSADGAVDANQTLVLQSASASFPGLVNNTTQTFSGNKTFTGNINAANLSGTNTGDVTIGTANGLSIAGQVLSLALATGASPGAVLNVGNANGVATLDGAGKIPLSQLPAAVFIYQGTWNPNTNTPTLVDGTGTTGFVYWTSAARLAAVSGLNNASMVNFQIGDLVIYNGTQWELTTPAAGVQSVNGFTGAVVLAQGNLTDVGTDGITVTGGTNAVWGSGTSLSQHVADATHNGYLSSADWNTFSGKQSTVTIGALDAQAANANGLALVSNVLSTQSADATHPGLVNNTTQTFSGNKTFTGTIGASNLSGTNTGDQTITLTSDVTGSGTGSFATTVAKIQGTTVSGTTGSTNVVFSAAPTLSNPVVGTQSQGDSSTKAASTAYVDVAVANAVSGVNPAVAVQAATTASSDTTGFTYNNGVSGIGATLTSNSNNTPLTVDGFTFTALGQRLLVKNHATAADNGIYYVTQVQASILPLILTRALDYDQPSDINNTGAIPVINGTVNGTTSWVQTAQVNTVGTDALVFVQFSANPASYLLKNASPVNHGVIISTSTGATSVTSAGTAGQVLTSNGASADPTFQPATGGGTTGTYYSGSMSSTSTWSTTNTGFVDGTNTGGNTLTSRISSGLTVTAAASNVAGITFTPPSASAIYLVSASFCGGGQSGAAIAAFQLVDGTQTVMQAGSEASASLDYPRVTLSGLYAPGTTSAVTLKIQMAAEGGGTTKILDPSSICPSIEWYVMQIK